MSRYGSLHPELACIVAAALLLAAGPAAARMYQWVNPQTGLSQLSGAPPSWYRSGQTGPRILVFENGTLVDDTALRVGEEKSDALRRSAYEEVQRVRELALERLKETADREADRAERELAAATNPPTPRRPGPEVEAELPEGRSPLEQFGAETIERLKAIISEFDRRGGEAGLPPVSAAPN